MPKKSKTRKHFGDFKKAVRFLRKTANIPLPFRVSRVKLLEDAGDCDLINDSYFQIRISNELSSDAAILVLLHEIAHLKVWHIEKKTSRDHDRVWGKAISEIYCLWFETT